MLLHVSAERLIILGQRLLQLPIGGQVVALKAAAGWREGFLEGEFRSGRCLLLIHSSTSFDIPRVSEWRGVCSRVSAAFGERSDASEYPWGEVVGEEEKAYEYTRKLNPTLKLSYHTRGT
jgi:hypothetical protein